MKTGGVRFQAAELCVVEAWVASCVPHSQHVQLTLLPAGDGDSLREHAWPQCLHLSRSHISGSSRPHPVCSPPSYCEISKERDILAQLEESVHQLEYILFAMRVSHVLWDCPAYVSIRSAFMLELRRELGDRFEHFQSLDSFEKSSYVLGSEAWEEYSSGLLGLIKDTA